MKTPAHPRRIIITGHSVATPLEQLLIKRLTRGSTRGYGFFVQASKGFHALAALPVVMGEATKKDGPALEAATGDMSHDLPLSTSRGDSVSLEDCELQYNQFVEKFGAMNPIIHVLALMGLSEEYERFQRLVPGVNLFREEDPRQVMEMEHEEGSLKYHAIRNKSFAWSWKAMVWSMDARTREKYARGGIIAFWFAPREEIDVREFMYEPGTFKVPPKVWDFYITRAADGATHRFHPEFGGVTEELCLRRPDTPPPERFEQTKRESSYPPQKRRAEPNAQEKAKAAAHCQKPEIDSRRSESPSKSSAISNSLGRGHGQGCCNSARSGSGVNKSMINALMSGQVWAFCAIF